jgi:hypothetical protein
MGMDLWQDTTDLWVFLPIGFAVTVLVEAAVLLPGLSARHPFGRRLFACLWLNACSYPIVVLVLPLLINTAEHRAAYLWVAETFAPACECTLFWAAFGTRAEWLRPSMWRDFAAIIAANLASFGVGEVFYYWASHREIPRIAAALLGY